MRKEIFIILYCLLLSFCQKSPLEKAQKNDSVRLLFLYVSSLTSQSAVITFSCSESVTGIVGYGIGSIQKYQASLSPSKIHSISLAGLTSDQKYTYAVFCGSVSPKTVFPQSFSTPNPDPLLVIKKRSIWIIGGIGVSGLPVAQVDMYDPATNTWYPSVTSLPTPRAFASVTVIYGKIYVIGGIKASGTSFSVSNAVEMYDLDKNAWTALSSMPNSLTGALAGKMNNEIYMIGGTTTTDMTTGTILNTVYRFQPSVGSTGTWTQYTVQGGSLLPRIDMAGCGNDGTIYMTGGRLYSSGAEQSSSDAFIPGANTTTSLIEASLNGARHGSASSCYRPLPSDPYPADSPALLVFGGSTATNVFIPASSITPSALYDYYPVGGTTNAMTAGPVLPTALYWPASEIYYSQRKAYLFGGASAINNPVQTVYSIDLANPAAGPWTNLGNTMPSARYGHRAAGVDR